VLTSIFEAALRSLLLAVLVWASLRVFRVHNVMYQRLAWTAVLAGALLMPFLLPFTVHWAQLTFTTIPASAPLHRLQAALSPAESAASPISYPSSIPDQAASVSSKPAPRHRSHSTPKASAAIVDVNPTQAISPRAASVPVLDPIPPVHSALPHVSIVGFIALTYFLVAAALLSRLLLGLISAMRVWHSAKPITFGINVRYEADANLRSSHKISSPVTIGSGIVLPAGYTGWSEEKLRIVLAHERSHVSQRDFHLLTLASLYAAVTWFSPLGWWLKHKLSDLGEAISDRSGLNAASNRSAYAQILLEFAAAPRTTLIGVAMARPSNISRRIERLLNDSYLRHAFSASGRARVAVLLVPVLLFAGAALVRVQAATQPAQAEIQSTQIAPAPSSILAKTPAPPTAAALAVAPAPPSADAFPAPPAPPSESEFSAPPAPPSADAFPAPPAPRALIEAPVPPGELALAAPPAPRAPAAGFANGASETEASFDRNLTFSGQLELSVSTGSGHITITRGAANQVHIHGVVKTNWNGDPAKVHEIAANPPIEQAGNKIAIGGHQDERLRNISIDYDIEAPADATLNAATGSGNIIVDSSGQGDATVQTGSGNIEVKGVHGALKAQTGSGEIKIAGTPSSAWKLETGSGSIELATGNAPMTVNATTGSGRISTEGSAMQTSSDEDHHHYHAQLNGGGPEVSVVTGSGSIHIR